MSSYTGPDRRSGLERRQEGLNGMQRETYQHLQADDKLSVLFDYLVEIRTKLAHDCPDRLAKCDARFDLIERRKWLHTAAASIGGVIGGFVAVIAKWLIESR